MESSCVNFDDESKKLIKELAKVGDKFNNLINKLKLAKENMSTDSGLVESFSEEIKK